MPKQDFHGGTHKHYYSPPTQQELNLESKQTFAFRIAPKLLKHAEKRAKQIGISTGKHIESCLYKYYKIEQATKEAHAVLDDIVGKIF